MGFFPSTIAAKLAGRTVATGLLCHMDFRDTPKRWWNGAGTLEAGGYEWLGTGDYIAIDGLQTPIGTAAPKTTFTVSGVDADLVTLARQASARVKDRRCTVFIQFFDVTPDDGEVQPFAKLDDPFPIWSGIMDQMNYTAEGPGNRTIQLTAESLWTNRRRPPYGYLTDRDQNARFPGDRGLEQVVNLINKTIRWPVFVLAGAMALQALPAFDRAGFLVGAVVS